ncbi:MAG TPA: transposase [Leptolyngbyaceae cyanobacterium M33_DOE_097]|uniref:Transposase IS200-like domain-containing protein n=1 Tax=Oscillatoriales cyanobacterium SpSt-418 TaxID=2282169 RepID=A0A7C3KE21_9CYAN|nr:transposase [Leptolyngbyaceae cyanobacterium M33_DOE_097]
MKYNSEKQHRRSLRLQGYDYAATGLYFITLCTYQQQCLFGEIVDGEVRLSDDGQVVSDEWMRSRNIRQEIDFDAWIIMPNHLHGIVIIQPSNLSIELSDRTTNNVGANGRSPLQETNQDRIIPPMKPRSLSSFVAGFKSATTKRINLRRNAPGTPVWQRNYYEHIIRDEGTLQAIRQYILNNPLAWWQDELHPDGRSQW